VSSSPSAQQALEIAKAFASAQPTQQSQNGSGTLGNGTNVNQQSSSTSKPAEVINMMTVDAPQQVMLEVKVAEVSKTLINQLGSALNIQGGFGSWSGVLVSNLLAGVSSLISGSKANNRPLSFAIDAQKTDDLVKILAEPNLVAISGQEATFLAGGKIFIPVPQSSSTGATTITLQEEEFGVGLKFTPTVLANGRISLKVAPEVSELSPTGITLSATNVSGVSILPLITTRRASTMVQMSDGESFAIGGLMKSNVTGALKAIPGIGEVPVLGALARSTSFQQDLTELVFIITPHLVKPLQTADLPLPTDSFSQPNEADVYATGNMEGRHPKMRTAPAGTPPAASPMPAPASVNPPAPLPSPAPAPQPSTGPVATASPQSSAQAAALGADRPRLMPDATAGTTGPADTPPSAETGKTARATRIESAAAGIASRKGRQDVANADASNHAIEH
jgi:pilus assembly protein CpaC